MFKTVNEDRMLKLIHNFFENPRTLITELVQNAVRAKAKKITINTGNGRLIVTDDGEGCDSISPILTLAESDWDKEVEENQQPAGWGLFVLYCLAREVEISSKFGTLKFDAGLFLNDARYRDSISYALIEKDKKAEGFCISATLKDAGLEKNIINIDDHILQFFPINIQINGRDIKQMPIEEIGKGHLIKTTYMGNEVFIGTKNLSFPQLNITPSVFVPRPAVIWYGIPISPDMDVACAPVIIKVTQGAPLTPVLPFRTSIKQDKKFHQFQEFVRKQIVEYCIEKINRRKATTGTDTGAETTLTELIHMRVMRNLATQEEINVLNRFYVKETQPYYNNYYNNGTRNDDYSSVVVAKGDEVFSDDIELRLAGKIIKPRGYHYKTRKHTGDYEHIYLPEGAIIQRKSPGKCPEWLKIKTRIHKIDIHIPKNTKKYSGNLAWCKARIESSGVALDVIGIDNYYGLGTTTIYYGMLASAWNLQHPIVQRIFNDGGDTFDTQEVWIKEQIREDLQNIQGNYSKYKLLEGFQGVGGIRIDNIKAVTFDKKKVTVAMKRGKEQVLALA